MWMSNMRQSRIVCSAEKAAPLGAWRRNEGQVEVREEVVVVVVVGWMARGETAGEFGVEVEGGGRGMVFGEERRL